MLNVPAKAVPASWLVRILCQKSKRCLKTRLRIVTDGLSIPPPTPNLTTSKTETGHVLCKLSSLLLISF